MCFNHIQEKEKVAAAVRTTVVFFVGCGTSALAQCPEGVFLSV